jgi:hypothetical protein
MKSHTLISDRSRLILSLKRKNQGERLDIAEQKEENAVAKLAEREEKGSSKGRVNDATSH